MPLPGNWGNEPQKPVIPPAPREPEVAGWLVVHDEFTAMQTFALKIGKQLIGRKSSSKPCDIMIDTKDNHMSRNHFWIEVQKYGSSAPRFILSDNDSTNHTFINTIKLMQLRNADAIIITDGDIIQAGVTKIVLKVKDSYTNSASKATGIVSAQKISKTMLLN